MNQQEYIKKALRSESKDYKFQSTGDITPRIEHAVYGLVTEAGELLDAIKKAKIYGQKLDKVNVVEELGDIMWYMALFVDALGTDFQKIWQKNIQKLKLRYPEKYTDENAKLRDLEAERKVLEN